MKMIKKMGIRSAASVVAPSTVVIVVALTAVPPRKAS